MASRDGGNAARLNGNPSKNQGHVDSKDMLVLKGGAQPSKEGLSPRKHLCEHNGNPEVRRSPTKAQPNGLASHKKTKSSVSLKSLMGNEKPKISKQTPSEETEGKKPKKSKSSTSLSALFSKSKSLKAFKTEEPARAKDKENQTPPGTADQAPTPIWAQFSTQLPVERLNGVKVPLNDNVDVEREAALYTPKDHSPSKQRNFYEDQPTLSRRPGLRPRPMSEVLPSKSNSNAPPRSFLETLSRIRHSENVLDRPRPPKKDYDNSRNHTNSSVDHQPEREDVGPQGCKPSETVPPTGTTRAKRGSRVMAAVEAFSSKAEGRQGCSKAVEKDVTDLNDAFENLLVRWFSRILRVVTKWSLRKQETYLSPCETR